MEQISPEVMDAIDFVAELKLVDRDTLMRPVEGYIGRIAKNLPTIQVLRRELDGYTPGGLEYLACRQLIWCCLFYTKDMDLHPVLEQQIRTFSCDNLDGANENDLIEVEFIMRLLDFKQDTMQSIISALAATIYLRSEFIRQVEYQVDYAISLIQ